MIFVICLVIAIIVMAEETSFGAASSVGVTHSRMAPWQQPLRESIILMTAVKISSWTKTVDARIRTDIGDAKMAWRGHWLRHSWHSGRLWHQKTRVHVQLLAIFMEHYRHNYSFFFFFFRKNLVSYSLKNRRPDMENFRRTSSSVHLWFKTASSFSHICYKCDITILLAPFYDIKNARIANVRILFFRTFAVRPIFDQMFYMLLVCLFWRNDESN